MAEGSDPMGSMRGILSPRLLLTSALLCVGGLAYAAFAIRAPLPPPPRPVNRVQPGFQPQLGLHYYAIQNLQSGKAEQRGTAGANGVAFDELVLAPDTPYRVWILQAETLLVGRTSFTTPGNGSLWEVPPIYMAPSSSPDSDGDGLHEVGEFVMGTNPRNADTDGDGIQDGAEVKQGSDPLDGLATEVGVLASVDTPGTAVDVCAANDKVVVADSEGGISVFNVFNRMDPRAIARVNTPGPALRVSCSGSLVAVACGVGGLAVVDVSDPPAAKVVHQVSSLLLGGAAQAVAVVDRTAYVGTSTGQLAVVELTTGDVLERINLGLPVVDLAAERDALYILHPQRLQTLPLVRSTASVAGFVDFVTQYPSQRLFVGNGIGYAVNLSGHASFDLTNPSQPKLLFVSVTQQTGWRHMVLNGSGLAPSARGIAGTAELALYRLEDPTQPATFVTEVDTPGNALALSLYNGLAYVAAADAGLQVVNYVAADTGGVAPVITLSTSFGFSEMEEGKLGRVSAVVSDDVQVRNVEWYVDGEKVATDGNFPFEFHFTAPPRTQQTFFTLQARASDTGGVATWSNLLTIQLTTDTTAPRVLRVVPRDDALLSKANAFGAYFSEAMAVASLTTSSLTLTEAGPDRTFNTPDDVVVNGGEVQYQAQQRAAFVTFASPLPPGTYRAQVTSGATDSRGNALSPLRTWTFVQFGGGPDSDNDGLPDAIEQRLGLNPNNPDSDGNGVPDGREDQDGDGLLNVAEVILGTDLTNPDSDGDGVLDGQEDQDQDYLTDGQEVERGTDPFNWDTDGDKFADGEEVAHGSAPLDAQSIPLKATHSAVSVRNEGSLPQALSRVSLKNQGGLEQAASTTSVKNEAAPEAINKRTEGPTFTVENTGSP